MGLNKTYFNLGGGWGGWGGQIYIVLCGQLTIYINILFPPLSETICDFPHVTTSLQTPYYTEIW